MFEFENGDALIIVDVQNDFLPFGNLAIENSDKIIPFINSYIIHACAKDIPIYYSLDWHPEDHFSFIENGGQWPKHCVQHTKGAELSSILLKPDTDDIFIYKGKNSKVEQYSAFDNTILHYKLRTKYVKRLLITGLAFDVCVFETIKNAYELGYEVFVDLPTTKAVTEDGYDKTIEYLMEKEIVTFV